VSPKVEGKNYYKQAPPSQRKQKYRGFNIREEYLKDLEADAKTSGFDSVPAYLRSLWDQDRERRGLAPIPHEETTPSEP
jgi:hypothetical protein